MLRTKEDKKKVREVESAIETLERKLADAQVELETDQRKYDDHLRSKIKSFYEDSGAAPEFWGSATVVLDLTDHRSRRLQDNLQEAKGNVSELTRKIAHLKKLLTTV